MGVAKALLLLGRSSSAITEPVEGVAATAFDKWFLSLPKGSSDG